MSQMMSLHPIFSCMQAIESQLQPCTWQPQERDQQKFLDGGYRNNKDCMIDDARWCSGFDIQTIGTFLEEHHFTARLEELRRNHIALAFTQQVKPVWRTRGIRTYITHENKEVSMVQMDCHCHGLQVHEVPGHQYPLVQIPLAIRGDNAFLTKVDDLPQGTFGLIKKCSLLTLQPKKPSEFEQVCFPRVQIMEQESHLEWMEGMKIQNGSHCHTISFARQKIEFSLDETGKKKLQSGAKSIKSATEETVYELTPPFIIWLDRKDFRLPYFAAHITKEDRRMLPD